MAREKFVDQRFNASSVKIIAQANTIIAEYQAQGFTLTLRQIYYQFVARDIIPNKQTEYKRLGAILNNARLAGLVDWRAMEDRERFMRGGDWGYVDPEHGLQNSDNWYQEEFWNNQPRHVEVWIEKNALIGVIEPACTRWRLPYLGCRGYVSQSTQYEAGKRLVKMDNAGRSPLILYLGDHDPSGMDMTRDHLERLAMFARWPVEVRRLALNMDQIEEHDPPPNPAKETDSRCAGYIQEFGESSWELDSLSPTLLDSLIEDQLQDVVDHEAWAASEAGQEERRAILRRIGDNYDRIQEFLDGLEE